ncbi:MAG: outer membrane beta-barrel protein [Pseudomonadota bacterium]
MRPKVRTIGNGSVARTFVGAALACALSALPAYSQEPVGTDRFQQAPSAIPDMPAVPDMPTVPDMDGTRIFSADVPDGVAEPPVQSGAEAFNIPSEVLYSWSGPSVGVRAGVVTGNGNVAASGALEVGYDFQPLDRVIAGIEADIALRGDVSPLTDTPALGTITGRLGFLPTERLLIFGEAGAALGVVRGATAAGGTQTEITSGYTLGAGAEFALDDQLTFVGEYTYTDLENRTVPTGTDQLRSSSFEAGIKFRF